MKPDVLAKWHEAIERNDLTVFEAIVADDAIFESPALHKPQRGKAMVSMYLRGALMVLNNGSFRYVDEWAYDLVYRLVRTVGLERIVFEASEPATFNWLVKSFGTDVNLFVDPSDLMTLAGLRAGIWGKDDTWGRVAAYRPEAK